MSLQYIQLFNRRLIWDTDQADCADWRDTGQFHQKAQFQTRI